MLSSELKSRTSKVHQELEREFMLHLRHMTSLKEYAFFLSVLYGFYQRIEISVEKALRANPEFSADLRERRKPSLLMDDMKELSAGIQPALCGEVPSIISVHDALGALYVVEGSALGGQIIAGIIARKFNIVNEKGISFFIGYGPETQRLWSNFLEHLNRPYQEETQNKIITTALETFITFKNWITKNAIDKLRQ